MAEAPQYEVEWDPAKARANLRKHGVSFEEAARILLSSRAVTLFDDEHSEREERWITLGPTPTEQLVVMVHTFEELEQDRYRVRVISARMATARERRQYEEQR